MKKLETHVNQEHVGKHCREHDEERDEGWWIFQKFMEKNSWRPCWDVSESSVPLVTAAIRDN